MLGVRISPARQNGPGKDIEYSQRARPAAPKRDGANSG